MQNKSGVILLNKPIKISSNSAVNKVKKMVGAFKAGHLGTLDPMASGLLPITLGKATKLFDYFLNKQKKYEAVFAFGFETDTLDIEGKLTKISEKKVILNKIFEILPNFIGKIKQLPPNFSAIKVNGKKAYDLARAGKEIGLKEREVEIFNIKVSEFSSDEIVKNLKNIFENVDFNFVSFFSFEIECGAGTYIRSLCRDIAKSLGTVGTMVKLVRTQTGKFKLSESATFEDIENGNYKILEINDVLDLPILEISSLQYNKLLCGQKVNVENFDGQKKLLLHDKLIGIASCKDNFLVLDTYLEEK